MKFPDCADESLLRALCATREASPHLRARCARSVIACRADRMAKDAKGKPNYEDLRDSIELDLTGIALVMGFLTD